MRIKPGTTVVILILCLAISARNPSEKATAANFAQLDRGLYIVGSAILLASTIFLLPPMLQGEPPYRERRVAY